MTGVQTCALPISIDLNRERAGRCGNLSGFSNAMLAFAFLKNERSCFAVSGRLGMCIVQCAIRAEEYCAKAQHLEPKSHSFLLATSCGVLGPCRELLRGRKIKPFAQAHHRGAGDDGYGLTPPRPMRAVRVTGDEYMRPSHRTITTTLPICWFDSR